MKIRRLTPLVSLLTVIAFIFYVCMQFTKPVLATPVQIQSLDAVEVSDLDELTSAVNSNAAFIHITDSITLTHTFAVSRDLTVTSGRGIVITGPASGRHFDITGGTVTFSGVSLDGNGISGGISVQRNAALVLDNVIIQNCNGFDKGGGVYGFPDSKITVSNSIIQNNSAITYGGGICADGNVLVVDNSLIKDNSAVHPGKSNAYYAYGGGIALLNGAKADISGSKISANLAKVDGALGNYVGYGGGIYVDAESVLDFSGSITTIGGDSKEEGNQTVRGGGCGIYYASADKSVTIPANVNVTFNNAVSSGYGGGVYGGDKIKLTIDGTNISNNEIINGYYGSGGGIAVGSDVTLTINDGSKIENNHCGSAGGGIWIGNQSVVKINGGRINGNTSNLNAGGIHAEYTSSGNCVVSSARVIMTDGEVCNNKALGGVSGGIYAYKVTISGGHVDGNTAGDDNSDTGSYAGGVMCEIFEMSGGSVSDNKAINFGYFGMVLGPGVMCADFNMSGGEIKNNGYTKTEARNNQYGNNYVYGGGVCINMSEVMPGYGVTMTGGVISGNTADYGGGIAYWTKGNEIDNHFTVSGGEISGNESMGSGGGILSNIPVTIEETAKISGNKAGASGGSASGGGVYGNKNITVKGGEITGNTATGNGGGLYGGTGSNISIMGGLISHNTANYGGGISGCNNGSISVSGESGISDNTANYDGGGIYGFSGCAITVYGQSVIKGNNAVRNGGGIFTPALGSLTVGKDVKFSGNTAVKAYHLTDENDAELHAEKIQAQKPYSDGPMGSEPFNYAYNNFDINYLKGEPVEYFTVNFNSNGGSDVANQIVISGGLATNPTDPTKESYRFAGWYRDNGTFEQQWNFDTDTVTSDITLYAKWTAAVTPTVAPTETPAVTEDPTVSPDETTSGSEETITPDPAETEPLTASPDVTNTELEIVTGTPGTTAGNAETSTPETTETVSPTMETQSPTAEIPEATTGKPNLHTPAISDVTTKPTEKGNEDGGTPVTGDDSFTEILRVMGLCLITLCFMGRKRFYKVFRR